VLQNDTSVGTGIIAQWQVEAFAPDPLGPATASPCNTDIDVLSLYGEQAGVAEGKCR